LKTEGILLLGTAVAFLLSWLVQPPFRSLGFLTGIVDHPGYRRSHSEPVPRTGGMAIFISFFMALYVMDDLVLGDPLPWRWLATLGGAGLAILALGVGDDRFHIHAEKKLYGQLVVIMALMLAGQRLQAVTLPLLGTVDLGGWSWPVTMFWFLGFINSMNLIDGLDGLASGIGVLACIAYAAVAAAAGDLFSLLFSGTLGGAIFAFLYWNVSRRKIFLGDSGSMWLGLVLGGLGLHLQQQGSVPLTVLLAPMVVPIWDTATTILRRVRHRTSLFEADDYHLHHRLVRLGFSPATTVYMLLLVTAGSLLFALSGHLRQAWLGLPALAFWLAPGLVWSLHRHRGESGVRLDFYSELQFALGLGSGSVLPQPRRAGEVARIINLQDERERLHRARAAAAGGSDRDEKPAAGETEGVVFTPATRFRK